MTPLGQVLQEHFEPQQTGLRMQKEMCAPESIITRRIDYRSHFSFHIRSPVCCGWKCSCNTWPKRVIRAYRLLALVCHWSDRHVVSLVYLWSPERLVSKERLWPMRKRGTNSPNAILNTEFVRHLLPVKAAHILECKMMLRKGTPVMPLDVLQPSVLMPQTRESKW